MAGEGQNNGLYSTYGYGVQKQLLQKCLPVLPAEPQQSDGISSLWPNIAVDFNATGSAKPATSQSTSFLPFKPLIQQPTATTGPHDGFTKAINSNSYNATLSFTGAISTLKEKIASLSASLSFTGAIASVHNAVQALTASLSFAGAIIKATSSRSYNAVLNFLAPAAVQSMFVRTSGPTPTLTMNQTPQVGNVLVTLVMSPSNTLAAASGWTSIADLPSVGAFDVLWAYRQVQAGDTATLSPWTTSSTNRITGGMWEYPASVLNALTNLPGPPNIITSAPLASSPPVVTITESGEIQAGGSALVVAAINTADTGTITLTGVGSVDGSSTAISACIAGHLDNTPAGTNSFTATFGTTASTQPTMAVAFIPTYRLTRMVEAGKAAALSFTGSVSKLTATARTASISFVGSRISQTAHGLAASLSFSGNIAKSTAHKLTATLSFSAAMAKLDAAHDAGTLSFSGSIVRKTLKILSAASISFSGSLTTAGRVFNQALTATLSFAGAINKTTDKALAASDSFSGTISKLIGAARSASLSEQGAIVKAIAAARSASLVLSAQEARLIAVSRSAALSFVGLETVAQTFHQAFTAALSSNGTVNKELLKHLAASLSSSGVINRGFAIVLVASVGLTGGLRRAISRTLAAAESFLGNIASFAFKPQRITLVLPIVASVSGSLEPVSQVELVLPVISEATLSL
ncbi:MAG: hypothetical protein KGL39_29235 [Patescibacteria group bacterium]|nr:hypothetical protein [Patescibacteria group bacterium]